LCLAPRRSRRSRALRERCVQHVESMLCSNRPFQRVNADAPPRASGNDKNASASKVPPRQSTQPPIRLLQQNRPEPAVLPTANDGCLRLQSGPWQATCTDRTMNGSGAREQHATGCIFSKPTRAAGIANDSFDQAKSFSNSFLSASLPACLAATTVSK
jgi:hypothetical protein